MIAEKASRTRAEREAARLEALANEPECNGAFACVCGTCESCDWDGCGPWTETNGVLYCDMCGRKFEDRLMSEVAVHDEARAA